MQIQEIWMRPVDMMGQAYTIFLWWGVKSQPSENSAYHPRARKNHLQVTMSVKTLRFTIDLGMKS